MRAALVTVLATACIGQPEKSDRLRGQQQILQPASMSSPWSAWNEYRFAALSGAKQCLGLSADMCKPCPAPEQNNCEVVAKQCDDLFCSPLCLKLAWSCEVTIDSAAADLVQAITEKEKNALCSQMIAWACSKEFGCCKDDADLYDWVERHAFVDQYPAPLFPFAPCMHDAKDEAASNVACNKCKSALGITFKLTPDACASLGVQALPAKEGTEGTKGGGDSGSKPIEVAPGQGGGSMKSLEERCNELSKKINTKLADVTRKANEMVCRCAGCCNPPKDKPDETCWFPITKAI